MGDEAESNEPATESAPDAPVAIEIELTVNGQKHKLSYEKAFSLACSLLENDRIEDASKLFSRLEEFADRGPRAFIMHAFCESAARHFDASKDRLDAAFAGDAQLAEAINDAFVLYHVASRQEGMHLISELVDEHQNLPTLCLLLGHLLQSTNKALATRCWSLALHRDRPGGAVGAVAMHHLRHVGEWPNSPTDM